MQAVGKIPCKNFLGTWLPALLHSNEVNQPIKLILYLRKVIGFSADHLTAELATGRVQNFSHAALPARPPAAQPASKMIGGMFFFFSEHMFKVGNLLEWSTAF